ncbi:phage tail fiber protein [Stenotrophomonas geniculata]|uniref:phage tail fiber domain-containing protein n=1 Tax=Stenotrophomonas geniculata TaxID=86188 RepID=UPI0039C6C9DF
MTVPAYTGPNTSIANGVTTVFPYSFRILEAAHIRVTVNGLVRTLGTHYTVEGVGNPAGGNVVFVAAPAANAKVVLHRSMPLVRLINYENLGDLLAQTLNEDQDAPVMMIQQIAADAMLLVPDPDGSGDMVWDAKNNRIVRVGDAIADADALNKRTALVLIEQIQNGGGTVGVSPKLWTFEGDGEVTDFPLAGADVLDPLFFDTAVELTAGAGNYKVSRPVDANGVGEFLIVPGTAGAPPAIRFNPPLGDGVRGFTTLRGYARPWIGEPPVYTVAPRIVSVTGNTTLAGDMHNTLILANSATPITLTMRANTGGSADWKEGQFFSVLQVGAGQVTLAVEGGGPLTVPPSFQAKTRAQGCIISGTCLAPDADAWVAAGDLSRIASAPDLQCFDLVDRSVLIGTNIGTGTGKDSLILPYGLLLDTVANGGIYATLAVAQAAGVVLTVDVNRNGTSILSTKLTFDNNERTTMTAAIPPVLVPGGNVLAKGDEISIDVDQVGTALAKGLRVYLVGQRAS